MERRVFLGGLMALLAAPLAYCEETSRSLVLIHLVGGNDGLNTVIPYRDPLYRKLRPTLSIQDALPLNGELALHPALASMKSLFDTKRLCLVNGVGYDRPSLSHFRSTEIWATASEQQSTVGWLGRYAGHAVSIGNAIPLSLVGRDAVPLTVGPFDRFKLPAPVHGYEGGGSGVVGEVMRRGRQALAVADRLARLHEPGGTGIGSDLQRVLALMRAGLGVSVYHVGMGGFDTHVRQAETHPRLLTELGQALADFQRDVEAADLGDRTLTVVFSEFGRRAEENSGAGTDHGTAGPMFLMGRRVRPTIVGSQPSLADLDDGNLRHNVDFREVYAAVLRDWLHVSPGPIIGAVTPREVLQ